MFLLLITSSLICVFWLGWRYKNRRLLKLANMFPGPPTVPVLGNALQFMCSSEEMIKVIAKLVADYGDVLRFWLGPDLNIVVSDPDDIKVLLTNMKTNVKGPQYKYMSDFLGGGILSGSGPLWRKHRKIATPNYGKRAIESYNEIFNKEVDLLIEKLKQIQTNTQFDIYPYIVQITSYSVCQTLMGLTKEQTMSLPHLQDIIDETPKVYDIVFDRMTKWYLQIDPVYWMTKYYKKQKHFLSMVTDFSKTIMSHRIEKLKELEEQSKIDLMKADKDTIGNTRLSVIDRFILSQELNSAELIQETFTIFTSSQEATAKISSYLLLMMAYHPSCQDKLYTEIKRVVGEVIRPISDEDLKQMPYLEMVFKEVIRLFPIGAMLQRTVTGDIAISSGTLPAGCSLVVPIYQLQRDPRYWSNPDDFDPERFTAENTKLRHPNCYIPFSLGPMDCLGRDFGTKLVKTICVRVLQEFKLTSHTSYKDLRLTIAISATSVNGYHTILSPRNQLGKSVKL